MVEYVLDTNICVYLMNRRNKSVIDKFYSLDAQQVSMSMVSYAELLFGVNKSQRYASSYKDLTLLMQIVEVLPMNEKVARHYADIRADLSRKGKIIGTNDLWIAAHTRALNKILVSNNLKAFTRVEGLKTENWL